MVCARRSSSTLFCLASNEFVENGEQSLLYPVVQITLDTTPGFVARFDDAGLRVAHLVEVGERFNGEAFVVQSKQCGGPDPLAERVVVQDCSIVGDDCDHRVATDDGGPEPIRAVVVRTDRPPSRIDESFGVGKPVGDGQ